MLDYKIKFRHLNILEVIIMLFIITQRITSIYFFNQLENFSVFLNAIELLLSFSLVCICLAKHKFQKKYLLIMAVLACLLAYCFIQNQTKIPIIALLIFIVGFNEKFDRVSEVVFFSYSFLFVLASVLYMFGISDAGVARSYDASRSAIALGFNHPNVASETLVFIFMSWACIKQRKIKSLNIIGLILCMIIWFIFKSRTSTFLLIILILIINKKRWNYNLYYVPCVAASIPVLLCLISYNMKLFLGTSIFINFNEKFAQRLFLINYQLEHYKLTLFGLKKVEFLYGLDNSYISFGLQYGFILMALFICCHILVCLKSWKRGRADILAFSSAMMIYAFMENGFFNPFVNFMFLYLLVDNKKNVLTRRKLYAA